MHSESTTSLNYWLAFLGSIKLPMERWSLRLHVTVFTKHQVPESCGHLPTIGIPKAIYHYMTNTTKQQPTYQLFQNIMRPKNQLVNLPKMTKFTSICAFSQFLLQICSYFWPLKLGQWANQSGSRCHMTCKMAGNVPILATTRGSRCWHRHARGLGSLLRDAKYG